VIGVAWIAFGCAVVPALLYLWNSFLFREPPTLPVRSGSRKLPRISVLIPARNEERSIAACVKSVLASRFIELEVIVLDDHSSDRTNEIVQTLAASDARVRLDLAPPLPEGWCGKQAACFALAKRARYEILTFLDADVRLEPEALARLALFREKSGSALVSGFPRQETVTVLERLLIPLIHWLLLSFLPLWAMRRSRWAAFGAGCGQWFLTTRAAYETVGGHEAVKASLHDGLTLPRVYRRTGFMTDLCDATKLATCRMYHSSREVWFGLAKNAREGMASTGQILFWTVVLFCGQVLPLPMAIACSILQDWNSVSIFFAAYVPQVFVQNHCSRWANRSKHNDYSSMHALGVLLLLAIQWYAVVLAVIGKPVGWKGRAHPFRAGQSQGS